MINYEKERSRMVDEQIAGRGVKDERVLAVMRKIPRHEFLPEGIRGMAYNDSALPIGEGQTISQPFIVAYMIEALELASGDRALEIGTGSGYAAAVLSRIAAEVYTVERIPELAESAEGRLEALGYSNIRILEGDGTLGWPDHAPYDAIVVTAGAPEVPQPLMEQLAVGGRLVIPVGRDQLYQMLVRVRRLSGEEYRTEHLTDVRFVPLIGTWGWNG